LGLAALGCLLLVSCGSSTTGGAVRQITKGQELAFYDFNEPHTFEEGAYGPATLRVGDGYYQIDVHQGDNQLWWGQWGDTYSDVMIEVDVNQISERNENAYGVMCRVRGTVGQAQTPDPTLVAIVNGTPETIPTTEATAQVTAQAAESQATTEATVQTTVAQTTAEATSPATTEATVVAAETAAATSEATATTEAAAATPQTTAAATVEAARPTNTPPPTATDVPVFTEGDGYLFLIQGSGSFAILRAKGRDITPLVDWTASDKIHVGPGQNHLRAICMGDYLALYVNDSFVGEATDSTYTQGQVGLVASAATRLGVKVNFDNLTISEATAG